MKALKKVLKVICRILFFPLFLFVNPITLSFNKRVNNAFWSFYYTFFIRLKSGGKGTVSCGGKQNIFGYKHFGIHGRFTMGKCNRIECLAKYSNQTYNPKLEIEDGAFIGDYCHIGCINKIHIGKNALIGSHVFIEDHNHGDFSQGVNSAIKITQKLASKGPIIIGDNVWIGEYVCILPGVTIGDNAIIGAGSVVTHDVEPNSVYVGDSAHKIR